MPIRRIKKALRRNPKQVRYVVEDAIVMCSAGATPTTLVASTNSKIGCKLRIVESDTGKDSFAATFGACAMLQGNPCTMSCIPKWLNTNSNFVSSKGEPCVTMDSFLPCFKGGMIKPLTDGQSEIDIDDFKKRLEALMGFNPFTSFCNDPVNTATGNFVYSKDDIEIQGQYPLVFKRFYNSIGSSQEGVLGKNWTHNFNIFLTKPNPRTQMVQITFDDGHVEEYYRRSEGSYAPPDGHLNTLTHDENGYHLTFPSMETYHFDNQGRFISTTDLNGTIMSLTYNHESLLSKVSTHSGSLSFKYNKQNRLVKITDHAGRMVFFEYEDGRLVAVTNPIGAVYRYKYNENGLFSDVINPLGVTLFHNEYDGNARNTKQIFPDGGFATTKYDDFKLQTINTEQNGNKVTYIRDSQFRTTRTIYDDSVEIFDYNENNKITKHVDRNKNIRKFDYDKHGNLVTSVDPIGGTIAIEYNEFNRPIQTTAPNGGVTGCVYDTKGNIIKTTDPLSREVSFSYDDKGMLVGVVFPNETKNVMEYDERGNIITIIDADGVGAHYKYDNLNRVIESITGNGKSTYFEYTPKGDIAKVVDPLGNTQSYEYNLSGKVTKVIDFGGGVAEFTYNNLGKIDEIVNQAGGRTKFTYDLMWNVASVTDPNGNVVNYEYDQHNRIIKTVDEEGNATHYEHDFNGNVTAVISPIGARTEIKYDKLDRQEEIIGPDGSITKLEYDKGGNIAQITDALGNITKREHDLAGQLIKLTDPLGNQTKFEYNVLGQVVNIINPVGEKLNYTYHTNGRLQTITLPSGASESFEYDKNGNTIRIMDSIGNETSLEYDSLNRVIKLTNALGHSKHFGYDAMGNITSMTDEKGNLSQYRYSPLGDIIEVIDPTGHSTKYSYDNMRRMTKFEQYRLIDDAYAGIKRPEYQITTYERNKKGEITAVTSPLGDVVKYHYDNTGQIVSKLDEDGLQTLYEYNLVGKLAKVSYADGKTVAFAYNPLKQLTAMHDWLGTTKIQHDEVGRATNITDFEGNEVGYAWNALGQREKTIYPDGGEVVYKYNSLGQIEKVTAKTGETNYQYNQLGKIASRVLPDKTKTNYEFNPLGAITNLTHSNKDGDILDQFKYTYDPVGNITQIEKQRAGIESDNGVFQYTYDELNRLCAVTHGENIRRYRYDELGNRIKQWEGQKYDSYDTNPWTTHSYNARNQLIRTKEGDILKEYRYDKRGNMTSMVEGGQLKAIYTFDATNMMVGAFAQGKGTAEYTYNGFRNRIKKLENFHNAQTPTDINPDPCKDVRFILDMTLPYNNLLMTQGTHNQSFIWGNSLLTATANETSCMDDFHYIHDHLDSPIRLINDDIHNCALAYDEFGMLNVENAQQRTSNHPLNNPFGFTGYQMDDVSGLYFAQAREYAPNLGRFMAQDLIKGNICAPFTLNQYGYVWGNPLIRIDLDGLTPTDRWWETPEIIDGRHAERMLRAYLSTLRPNQIAAGPHIPESGNPVGGVSPDGRTDIVYTPGMGRPVEIYEVKAHHSFGPHNPSGNNFATRQLQRYIDGYLLHFNTRAVHGHSLNAQILAMPPFPAASDPNRMIEFVMYPQNPGLVFWRYQQRNDNEDCDDTIEIPVIVPGRNRDSNDQDNNRGNPNNVIEFPQPQQVPARDRPAAAAIEVEDVLIAGGAIAAGYLIWRGIRLLPSLFPPLWWTLPKNLVIP